MYDIKDFEAYTLRKFLGYQPVLAWSQKNGYHFLTFTDQMLSLAAGEQFKIVGVLKCN